MISNIYSTSFLYVDKKFWMVTVYMSGINYFITKWPGQKVD